MVHAVTAVCLQVPRNWLSLLQTYSLKYAYKHSMLASSVRLKAAVLSFAGWSRPGPRSLMRESHGHNSCLQFSEQ